MAGKVKGLTVEINGEVTGLRSALKSVSKDAKSLRTELKQVERLSAYNPTDMTLITQRQTLYGKSIRATAVELERLRGMRAQVAAQDDGTEEAARQIREYDRAIANAESQLLGLSRGAVAFGASASSGALQAAASFDEVGTSLSAAGAKLIPVSLAAAGIGTVAVNAAMEFESSFAGVRKTINATEQEYARLAAATREFALEKPINVNDVNQIMEWAGQLGIATENLSKFTDTVADLTVATDLDLQDASMKLAQFINITGVGFEGGVKEAQANVDRLGAVIADLGNNTATTETKIVNMAMRVAGTGSQIGLTQQEILGLSATLAAVGIEAEMGGNAISTILNKIDKDIDNNTERLSTWADVAGMSVDEFTALWKNSDTTIEAIKAVVSGLGEYKDEAGNLNTLLTELGVNYMRQIDTAKRLTNAGTQLTDNINLANHAWDSNSALTREAEQRYQTLESRIQVLKNTANDAAITFGNDLVPAVKGVVDAATGVVSSFSGMSDAGRFAIESMVGFAAILAPTILLVGKTSEGLGRVTRGAGSLLTAFRLLKTGTTEASAGMGVLQERTMTLTASDGRLVTVTRMLNTETSRLATQAEIAAAAEARLAAEATVAAARTKLMSTALTLAKSAGFDAAVIGVFALVSALAKYMERAEKAREATKGLTDAAKLSAGIASDSAEAVMAYGSAFQSLGRSLADAQDANATLAGDIREKWQSVNIDSVLVERFSKRIAELAGNTADSAAKQAELKNAVDSYNAITGESVRVIDEVNGTLDRSIDKLQEDTDAWLDNAKAQAAQQQAVELMRERIQIAVDMQSKLNTIRSLQSELANVGTDIVLQENLVRSVQAVTGELQGEYDLLLSNTDALNTLYSVAGIADSKLGVLDGGVSLADRDLSLLQETLGIEIPAAAAHMASGIEDSSADAEAAARDMVNGVTSAMDEAASDAYNSGYDAGQNFNWGLSAWIDNIAQTGAKAMEGLAEFMRFSVPEKGVWSGAEKGGETSGRHFVENYARGMESGMKDIDAQVMRMSYSMAPAAAQSGGGVSNSTTVNVNNAQINSDAEIRRIVADTVSTLRRKGKL